MVLRRESRPRKIVVVLISIGIIVPGGYGFIEKFIQFVRTLGTEGGAGFTLVPIMNYLLVAAGFTCLLVWAVAHGMFRDVEAPKHTMLERERALEEREHQSWSEQ